MKEILRFENGKIMIGGKDLLVVSASLSMNTNLQVNRVYGDYDPKIAGAKTEVVDYVPNAGLRGTLDISFYISADTFAVEGIPNNIERMFEIIDGMSEEPIDNNLVGRYRFNNIFLKSFSFSARPLGLVRANASYEIYGTMYEVASKRFHKTEVDFAHAVKSFGGIKASGVDIEDLKIFELNYSAVVSRSVSNLIRHNEHTSRNTYPEGVVPSRVSVEGIEKEIKIKSSEIVQRLNAYGDYQPLTSPEISPMSSINIYLLSNTGDKIAAFDVYGKIMSQSMNIQEGNQSVSEITIKEVVK